jgi:DNA-binding MarR family transcriptional regulator
VTASQLHALPEIASAGAAGMRPAALARCLGVTRQSVQKLVDGLLDAEVVTVHADPGDGRATVVVLTDAGRRLVADLATAATLVEKELVRRVGREQVAALASVLGDGWNGDSGA